MLSLERTENTLNETLHKLWHGTSRKDVIDVIVQSIPPKYQVRAFPNAIIIKLIAEPFFVSMY